MVTNIWSTLMGFKQLVEEQYGLKTGRTITILKSLNTTKTKRKLA